MFAGLEYGKECCCGVKKWQAGFKAEKKCNMACKENSMELCRAGNFLNSYSYAPPATTAKPRAARRLF
jgi:hypothetical protein